MDKLVKELATEYRQGNITWHDIQDIADGYAVKKCGCPIKNKYVRDNVIQISNTILKKIEKTLRRWENEEME